MALPNAKELKKLTAACRKAGIKVLKVDGMELTLAEEAPPVSEYRRKKAIKQGKKVSDLSPEEFEKIVEDGWESMSEEQRLFYSVEGMGFEDDTRDQESA